MGTADKAAAPEGWREQRKVVANLSSAEFIGPERTVDFPINLSESEAEPLLVRLHFRDEKDYSWEISEVGRLRRMKKPLSAKLFGHVLTGEVAKSTDHSHIATESESRPTLARVRVSRFEVSEADGNSITLDLTGGTPIEPTVYAEFKDPERLLAQASFDDRHRLISFKACNLPSGTRGHIQMRQYLHGDGSLFFFFASDQEELEADQILGRLNSGWPISGPPIGHIGNICYDEAGFLLALQIFEAKKRLLADYWK